ncbi:MAG: diguanylate cyclase [Armatimonas sp.]
MASALMLPAAIDSQNEEAYRTLHQDTRRALELCTQTRESALSIDYRPGIAQSTYLIAQCRLILWGTDACLDQLQQAFQLFQSLGDRAGEADALNILAIVHGRRGDHVLALEFSQKCLHIRRSLGDVSGEAKSLNNIGVIYRDLLRFADALESLFRSYELAEQIGSAHAAAYATGNIGEVFYRIGELSNSRRYFQQSLELVMETDDLACQSTALAGLGKTCLEQGEHEEAIDCLRRALELDERTGNIDDKGTTLYHLGRAYLALEFYPKADEFLTEALEIFRLNGNQNQEIEVSLSLSRSLLNQGRGSDAIASLRACLDRSGENSGQVHQLLSAAYEKQGDLACALVHFKAFYEEHERVYNQKARQRIRELITRSEVQKMQRDVDEQRQANDRLAHALEAAQIAEREKEDLLQQLVMQTEILKQLAREDGLTGIANRRWLDAQLGQEFDRARRFGHQLSVALIDLDHFKSINDRFSHQVGDDVLRTVARLLRDNCRSVDLIGRYGGEEFLIVLVETSAKKARPIAERIRERIANYPWTEIHPGLTGLTLSIGLCSDRKVQTAQELVAGADKQLYRAKAEGRNRVYAG